MKVKRTWKTPSLRAGQEQIDDEATVRKVFGQTAVAAFRVAATAPNPQ